MDNKTSSPALCKYSTTNFHLFGKHTPQRKTLFLSLAEPSVSVVTPPPPPHRHSSWKRVWTQICLLCLLKRKDRRVRVGRGDGESQWSGDALLHTCLAPRSRARLCSRQTDLSSRLEEFYLISVAGFTSNIGFRFSTNRKREVKRNNSNYEAQRLQIHSRHMLHVIKLIQKAFGYHYLQRKWANKQTKKNQVKPVG